MHHWITSVTLACSVYILQDSEDLIWYQAAIITSGRNPEGSVHAVYGVTCTVCNTQCLMCSAHCVLCCVHCEMCPINRVMCSVLCVMQITHCIMCTLDYVV